MGREKNFIIIIIHARACACVRACVRVLKKGNETFFSKPVNLNKKL